MKLFDPTDTPLTGTNLIEASAGTGKTYTIEGLFLRLVLELRLSVEQILVVTFTKAATEELKTRIRGKLLLARSAVSSHSCDDPFVNAIIARQINKQLCGQLIQKALVDFDQASIFTIHGFCQRILHEHTFETGNLFDAELITDQRELLDEIADDFWRKHLYRAQPEVVQYVLDRLKTPQYFANLVDRVKTTNIKIMPDVQKPALEILPKYREAFLKLKTAWFNSRSMVEQLLKNPALNGQAYGSVKAKNGDTGLSKRDLKVMALIDAMDRFVAPMSSGYPIFKEFEKFTAAKISQSVKTGQPSPRHDFFAVCDAFIIQYNALITELELFILYLKREFFKFAEIELYLRKKENNVQFFDDLLLRVKNALSESSGSALAAAIRHKYRAALVDEFQDTDPIQYEIFSHLFSSNDHILFMIGDPKQAIYGFRGADIFTYMHASRAARNKHTLTSNWRSDPGMIRAVNGVFSRANIPFIFTDIPFIQGEPGGNQTESFVQEQPSLTIWFVRGSENKPLAKTNAAERISNQVVAEILHLLQPENQLFAAGEIAILVRTNRQAQLMKACLSKANVPSVLYGAGNIFESREAIELEKVLACVCEPNNDQRLRAALVTDMMGVTADLILQADRDPDNWERRRVRMREYHRIWARNGFIQMIRRFLTVEKVRVRLLSFPDGERRLTNLLHLVELLQQQSEAGNPGSKALLKWFWEQRRYSLPRQETHQLRLESDENAVKIVTIHKSKGLEYPVVFCPFAWEGATFPNQELLFHDPSDGSRKLDISPTKDDRNVALFQKELLAENIRLLYVALTRAKKRCYLTWGNILTAESSSMAYLFHCDSDVDSEEIVTAVRKIFLSKTDSQLLDDLKRLVDASSGSITVKEIPENLPAGELRSGHASDEPLMSRKFTGAIDSSWRVLSYSSLIHRTLPPGERPDRDAVQSASVEFSSQNREPDIFLFPKGSRAGTFFHDVFEKIDFTGKKDSFTGLVETKLQSYGFDLKWRDSVCRTIQRVISIPLLNNHPEFKLAVIDKSDRLNELEFFFQMDSLTSQKLMKIFKASGIANLKSQQLEQLENVLFLSPKGFIKGYIDLVFRYQDRFYIVDWKSNYLGSQIQDYHQKVLGDVMQRELYYLQYQIYTLAVHLYLRQRIPGYSYENNFGGVYYIFLRGVDPDQGAAFGIYRDMPAPEFVYLLEKTLVPQAL